MPIPSECLNLMVKRPRLAVPIMLEDNSTIPGVLPSLVIPYMLWVNGNDTVKVYSTDGKFIGGFGSKGNGTGQLELYHPCGICTDRKGRMLVADYGQPPNSNIHITRCLHQVH